MYRVMIVDDEPIILSGIKFLIDWAAQGCEIIGTARNGQQALEAIERFAPDIVVSDIRMPVKSGIELLEEMNGRPDAPVFIMLTNYQDFDMARQALRLRAADYLVKTQLEPAILEASLARAKAECDKRGKLARMDLVNDYMESSRNELLRTAAQKLLRPTEDTRNSRALLAKQGVFDHFCLVQLMLDFSALPTLSSFSRSERRQLLDWEGEVVDKLAGNLFENTLLATPDYEAQSLLLVCWKLEESPDWDMFHQKLVTASTRTTQTQLALLTTDVFNGVAQLDKALAQLTDLRERYYIGGSGLLTSRCLLEPAPQARPLELHDVCNRLALELRAKDRTQALTLLDKARDILRGTPHLRGDAVRCCCDLYSVCSMVLGPLSPEGSDSFFSDTSAMLASIQNLSTLKQVLDWLDLLARHVAAQLDALDAGRSNPVEKARQYVRGHVDERILLQDVADYVGLSPSYLSALFKKEYNQNFVDFINETKMHRACELIRDGKYRIYEISYMLSFENAYYFTRVFRRHMGMTPTEYQRSLQKENED